MKSKLPIGWKEVMLGDIVEIHNSKRIPLSSRERKKLKKKYRYYGAQGIIDYVDDYIFNGQYLLVAEDGENLRSRKKNIAALVEGKFWVNNHAHILTQNSYSDLRYLFYSVNSIDIEAYLTGSVQPKLNKRNLESLRLNLPTLKEQKVIADTLSALDDKIENNNKINEKLEQQAQEIFKHWFIDFEFTNKNGMPYKSSGGEMVASELGMIPKGWKVCKLEEVVDNIQESVKPGEHLSDREYLPINNLSMNSVTIKESESYKEAKSSLILFEKLDILIGAMRVYFHRVNLAPFKGVTRTTTFVIRSRKEVELSYNLFLLNLEETISYANKTSKGTTMPYAVWKNGLAEMPVANPPLNMKEIFNETILASLKLMINNADENKKLSELRDTLLPKLMSGELRIPIDE